MAIGETNIGATPCCGVIKRNWEATPDSGSSTGILHNPGGDYAPSFEGELELLDQGICPDCGASFEEWLQAEAKEGHARHSDAWHFSFNRAADFFVSSTKEEL